MWITAGSSMLKRQTAQAAQALLSRNTMRCKSTVASLAGLENGKQLYSEIISQGWSYEDKHFVRNYQFDTFLDAWAFLTQIAMYSHKKAHHPYITNVYNEVTLKWTTHDAGDVSKLDYQAAKMSDKLYKTYIKDN